MRSAFQAESTQLVTTRARRGVRSRWRGAGKTFAVVLAVAAPHTVDAQMRPAPGGASPVAFWNGLGDSTLVRLIVQALETNPDLHAAAARVRGARAGRVDAALELAPIVTANAGYSRQRLASATVPGAGGSLPGQDLWDAGLQMSWELDLFGRGRRTLQGRSALVGSAEEDVRDVQVLLAATVARLYYDLRAAQERLAVASRNAENQQRTLEVTLERLDAGRGTGLDTERAQTQLSATLAVIPALEAEIAATRHRIAILLGRPPASLALELGDEAPAPTLPPVDVTASGEAVARQRPDVRSAERQLAAYSAFTGAAKAAYLPRVSINGVAGYTANAFESLGNSGTPRYAVGPAISWPLFDLGRVKSGVDAARAGEAEAEARYRRVVLDALEEVETAIITYDKARERLQHLEAAAGSSERATELARLRFEEGATGFLEVLDAERTQLETQDRLALGRREATLGLVAVYRALGGDWPVPIEPGR